MKPNESAPPAQLMKFIVGKWISKPIYVAAELGIADMPAKGPKSTELLRAGVNGRNQSLKTCSNRQDSNFPVLYLRT